MIKFYYHKYALTPMGRIGLMALDTPRKGALLKIEWAEDGIVGFSDLHPWPELGDHELNDHLDALSKGKISTLVEQSIWLARRDAEARANKESLFSTTAKVKNHFLVTDFSKLNDAMVRDVRSSGFSTLKIKCGRDIEEEPKVISRFIKQNPNFMLRLDFNAKANFQQIERFFSFLQPAEKAKIEFVEDPVPIEIDAWNEIRKIVPVAADLEFERIDPEKITEPFFDYLIVKPARVDVEMCTKLVDKFPIKMVVTSALDHPVGVAHACGVATRIKKFYPNKLVDCGCLTTRVYAPNDFSNAMVVLGPYLQGISGTGIGFDDLFARTEWTPLLMK